MKKNIKKVLTSKDVNAILELASELELDIEQYEGSLLDNYIIHAENKIKVNRCIRNYIIIKEEYLNEWTSQAVALFTDDLKTVEKNKNFFK